MLGKKGFGVKDLAPIAIVFVLLAIVVSMGSLILGNMQTESYNDVTVTNETFDATSTDFNYTVAKASGDANFAELVTAQGFDTVSQDTEVNTTILDKEAGKVNFEYGTDPSTDTQSINYDYHQENTASGVIDKGNESMSTFGDWFGILVVVVIAAVVIGIVMRYFGGNKSRRL